MLDDELERLKISCIAGLSREKASIKGLFRECLSHTVNLNSQIVCKPADIFKFLKSYPMGLSSQTVSLDDIELMYTYFLEEDPNCSTREVVFEHFIEKFLRP